jgi:hypothetical protein
MFGADRPKRPQPRMRASNVVDTRAAQIPASWPRLLRQRKDMDLVSQ